MIVRLLLFILVFAAGWTIYRLISKNLRHLRRSSEQDSQKHGEAVVKCVTCGTYVPASHAIYDQHQTAFCCAEHKQK